MEEKPAKQGVTLIFLAVVLIDLRLHIGGVPSFFVLFRFSTYL